MRLNKYIAAAGICSRRKADELIANGNVKVNGAVVQQMGVDVGEGDVVMVNGNEATVKYFRREGDLVILTPKSFNPVHQPQIYDLKRVPVRIAGLVVECRKVFR